MSVSTKGPLPASRWISGALLASALVVARGYGIWGRLSDLIGRRLILVVGLIGFAVTLAVSALVPSLPVLYVGRILNRGLATGEVLTSAARVPPLRKSSRCLSRPPGFWPLL
jgi:MFS family permease